MSEISVVSLKIKNFMSISDAEIKPSQVNVIIGANEQGKTSVLKAIQSAAKNVGDPNLVRRGEEQAEIVIELKDEYCIDRKIKADGTNKVSLSRGLGDEKEKLSSPQTIIDRLFDGVSFNPVELLDPKKRNESIMGAIALKVTPERLAEELGVEVGDLPPLDYDKHGLHVLDQAYKYFYQRRAEANRDADIKKQKYMVNNAEMKSFSEPSIPMEKIESQRLVIKELMTNISNERIEIKSINSQIEKENNRIDDQEKTLASYNESILKIEEKIKKLEQEREDILNAKEGFVTAIGKIEKKNYVSDSHLDEREKELNEEKNKIEMAAKEHEIYQGNINQVRLIDSMKEDYEKANLFALELTKKVDLLRSDLKKKMLAEVDMPIEGLEFIDGQFWLNGNSIDLLSSSAALRLSIAIARKLNKRTKLICIDGAEMIDDENFKTLSNEIKGDGYTYFITKVGDHSPSEGQKVFKMNQGKVSEL